MPAERRLPNVKMWCRMLFFPFLIFLWWRSPCCPHYSVPTSKTNLTHPTNMSGVDSRGFGCAPPNRTCWKIQLIIVSCQDQVAVRGALCPVTVSANFLSLKNLQMCHGGILKSRLIQLTARSHLRFPASFHGACCSAVKENGLAHEVCQAPLP